MWQEELPDPQGEGGDPDAAGESFGDPDFSGMNYGSANYGDTRPDDFDALGQAEPGVPFRLAPKPGISPTSHAPFPHIVSIGDLYQAAYARALADQELTRLFNPDYDI